jgi:hypothetical protein
MGCDLTRFPGKELLAEDFHFLLRVINKVIIIVPK